uniref:Uncharacterized protein n=1 Tax=Arundo donax TaxID=35708 RepID=A0A0A9H6A5_ARUDO
MARSFQQYSQRSSRAIVIKVSYQSNGSYKNESCTKFPNSWGMPPVKLQPDKILKIIVN